MAKTKSPGRVKGAKHTSAINGTADDSIAASPPPEDAPTPAKKSRLNDSVASSSANAMGFELEANHIVAVMDHCKLKLRNEEEPTFVEHVYKSKKKILSLNVDAAPDVTFVNSNTQPSDDAFDYCLAVYDRSTKEVSYQPAEVLNFEGHYKVDPRVLQGKSTKKKTDFTADYSLDREAMLTRRKELTSQFGSTKKNKMLEAAVRRSINTDTLSNLSTSTFDSKNAVAKKDNKAEDLKALDAPVSVILPPANLEADTPSKIYDLKHFYNEHTLDEDFKAAEAFFKDKTTVYKYSELELHEFWANIIVNRLKSATKVETVLLHKMIIMTRFMHMVFNSKSRNVFVFEELCLPDDADAYFKFIKEFFAVTPDKNGKMRYTQQERDRVVAHALCLWLIFNDFELPVTPLTTHFGVYEKLATKTLTALGCNITSATPAEIEKFDTAKVARLTEPPSEKKKSFQKRK
uniref:tRNA-synt_1g domain-containing protein n=1 Tax=Panagrellus redivivus TaxID=6233 RepID=A0A7E4V981_PANRE